MSHIFQCIYPDLTQKAPYGRERSAISGANSGKKRIWTQVADLYHGLDAKRGEERTGTEPCRLSCRARCTARDKPCHRPAGVETYDPLLGWGTALCHGGIIISAFVCRLQGADAARASISWSSAVPWSSVEPLQVLSPKKRCSRSTLKSPLLRPSQGLEWK